jgi:lipoate-protein ligase B
MPCIAALPSIFNRHVSESKDCIAVWHGRVQYAQALDLQMKVCELKKHGFDRDVLLLLEHPPTITLGRNASVKHLLAREEELESQGVLVCNADRGGDITFHGPGQLVGYPLLSLKPEERDVHRYMRNLEESLINLLASYNIPAGREERYTGVWTDQGKIAAMGVHISRWITRHGFALNVNTDLSFYNMIVPCGIVGKGVTSMQKELSRGIDLAEVAERYIPSFASVFHRNMILMSPEAFLEDLSYPESGDIQQRVVI